MLCGINIGKTSEQWPTLIENFYDFDHQEYYITVTNVDSLILWVSVICHEIPPSSDDDDNAESRDRHVPVCGSWNLLTECINSCASHEEYELVLVTNVSNREPGHISELSFDNLRLLDKMGLGDLMFGIENVTTVSIKYKTDKTIMDAICHLPETGPEKDDAKSDKPASSRQLQENAKVIQIPYWECNAGSNVSSTRFCLVNVPFLIQKRSLTPPQQGKRIPKRTNDILFNNVGHVNKMLYSKCGSYLRDYAHLITHDKNSSGRYARIDPMTYETTKKLIPNDFLHGTFGVHPKSGSLSLASITFDQWVVKDHWGIYPETLGQTLNIVYVGLHSSHFDERTLGFPGAILETYGTPQLFENLEKNPGVTCFLGNSRKCYTCANLDRPKVLASTIFRQKSSLSHIEEISPDLDEILLCWDIPNCDIPLGTLGEESCMTSQEAKCAFSKMTFLSESYFESICYRLLPFLCTVDPTSNTISLKKDMKIKLRMVANRSQFKVVVNKEWPKKHAQKGPYMMYFYNDEDAFFEQTLSIPIYKDMTSCFCAANLDRSVVQITNKKKDLVSYLDFGYEDILKTGRSILGIAIEICRICHASIHEVFHGGKMLWHLRAVEHLMCLNSKPKPNKMKFIKDYHNKYDDIPFSWDKVEEWELIGAHVGNATLGWFVKNGVHVPSSSTLPSHPNGNTDKPEECALFFDFDGYYNSLICEYKIGFLCHNGFLTECPSLGDMPVLECISGGTLSESSAVYIYALKELPKHFEDILLTRRQLKKEIQGLGTNITLLARYIALKLVSNTFYGCCGKQFSPISSKFVSNLITAYGRRGEHIATSIIQNKYKLQVGHAHTDGICFKIRLEDFLSPHGLCKLILDDINAHFPHGFTQMALEEKFEALYISSKTGYVGIRSIVEWQRHCDTIIPEQLDKLKSRIDNQTTSNLTASQFCHALLIGIQSIKRDNAIYSWTRFKTSMEKNIKCKAIITKNWSFFEVMCFYLSILAHTKEEKALVEHVITSYGQVFVQLFLIYDPSAWVMSSISSTASIMCTDTNTSFVRFTNLFDKQYDTLVNTRISLEKSGGVVKRDINTSLGNDLYDIFCTKMGDRCALAFTNLTLTTNKKKKNKDGDHADQLLPKQVHMDMFFSPLNPSPKEIIVSTPLQLAQVILFSLDHAQLVASHCMTQTFGSYTMTQATQSIIQKFVKENFFYKGKNSDEQGGQSGITCTLKLMDRKKSFSPLDAQVSLNLAGRAQGSMTCHMTPSDLGGGVKSVGEDPYAHNRYPIDDKSSIPTVDRGNRRLGTQLITPAWHMRSHQLDMPMTHTSIYHIVIEASSLMTYPLSSISFRNMVSIAKSRNETLLDPIESSLTVPINFMFQAYDLSSSLKSSDPPSLHTTMTFLQTILSAYSHTCTYTYKEISHVLLSHKDTQ